MDPEAAYIRDVSHEDVFAGAPSFTLSHRLTRVAWNITWTLLAAWTPAPFRPWRVLLLRLFGADVHPTANVYGSARVFYPRNLTLAAHAALGRRVNCYNMARITVGERAVVSQGAHLCGGTHAIDDPSFQLIARPIVVGAHAWVAAEAFVGPGTTIGEGAVLGARAVAVKDVPAWTVYAGNPARFIRDRKRVSR